MAEGGCIPYLNRLSMAFHSLLDLGGVTDEALHIVHGNRRNTSQGNLEGRQQNKSWENVGRQEIEANTKSMDFEMKENTSRGDLGVQKRTCGSLSVDLWFLLLNLCS
jgi:hypothetical protein